MSKQTQPYDEILKALRARIFLADPTKDMVLRETGLAKEFGLSRTPIRQMLQTLSHEHLVRVQTGVGTIATKLDARDRDRDFRAYAQIALAAVGIPGNEITSDIKMRIMGLSQMAEDEVRQAGNRSLELFVSLAQESGEVNSRIIGDPVVSSALAAARWRVVRWRIVDYLKGEEAFWETTLSNFARNAESVKSGDAAAYLKKLAQVVADMREL